MLFLDILLRDATLEFKKIWSNFKRLSLTQIPPNQSAVINIIEPQENVWPISKILIKLKVSYLLTQGLRKGFELTGSKPP